MSVRSHITVVWVCISLMMSDMSIFYVLVDHVHLWRNVYSSLLLILTIRLCDFLLSCNSTLICISNRHLQHQVQP